MSSSEPRGTKDDRDLRTPTSKRAKSNDPPVERKGDSQLEKAGRKSSGKEERKAHLMEIQQLREQHELQQKLLEEQRQQNDLLIKRIADMERRLQDQTIGRTTPAKLAILSTNL